MRKKNNQFWASYADLMTSLFFIMLLLFILLIGRTFGVSNKIAECEKSNTNLIDDNIKLRYLLDSKEKYIDSLNIVVGEVSATNEQLNQILQIENQFKELSESSSLVYIDDRKMFVAKDLIGIEIFEPLDDKIKSKYINTVDSVGYSILKVVRSLYHSTPDLRFQLIIEGNAAIPWKKLKSNSFNPNDIKMYKLSYNRALTLYLRWLSIGIDLRKYNTEVIVAGSGFNGVNRDSQIEENNKRFVIQIIPKISKPS